MKHLVNKLLLSLAVSAVTIVCAGAALPPLTVMVLKDGKTAYKGATSAAGTFSTGKLAPGNYVVQFNSESSAVKSGQFSIVVSAGKKKVSASGVAGEKLAKGGVAMKVEVGSGMNISGQIVKGALAAAAADTAPSANGAKVKVENGKRYVWVGPETGSNMGGHWEEESLAKTSRGNVQKGSGAVLGTYQDKGQDTPRSGGN
ncbi:MAG: hypothetical protein ABI992_09700 [Chthoniobacterales bacterium]